MSKNSLETLFESKTRIKILKFLYRNYKKSYSLSDISNHTRETSKAVSSELSRLERVSVVSRIVKKPWNNFEINPNYEYFNELRDLLLKSTPSEKQELKNKINKLGKIRVAIIGGVFLDKENSDPLAVDIFLAHDYLDKRKFTQFLKNLEAEVGKEIKFATMEKEEFKYRLSMFDRFVRVLLESPHEKLINKLGI